MRKLTGLMILLLLMTGFSVMAQDEEDDMPGSDSLAVTVYNQGSALVQDRRTFNFNEGQTVINFTDVASAIDATSVSFKSLTDPENTRVLEQNYIYDLVNSDALLERYLDETIQVTTIPDGQIFTGQLLSGRGGDIILRDEDGGVFVVSKANVRDIQFPELPSGLITRPTLRWLVGSETAGEQQVELTYLTGGISWTADYNVLLGTDSGTLDLNGWVTFDNRSGTAYDNATIKLVAGDVNRIQPEVPMLAREESLEDYGAFAADAAVEQREFFEYQLYEIGRPVTLGNNETKQVEFVTGADVPATTFYVYDSSPQFYGYYDIIMDQYYGQTGIRDVQNYLEFTTAEDEGLGADLPAGRIRVYQEDIDGAALLIGENFIDHTPEGEDVQLYLGNAFDLVGERTQTDFQILTGTVMQETYEIRLRNRKDDEAVEIRIPERLFRWSNWTIEDSSHDYEQLNSNTVEFRVTVEPGEEVVLSYTVQYSWPR
ncbi:MAG: DUF4139 domain-containing protein [Aggregatilineales bacterium]